MILENILKEEAGEGILVLENFKETIKRAGNLQQEDIEKNLKPWQKEASGVLGTLKILPRALQNINWLELALALATIFIVYGFKRITTKIPSALVALVVVSGVAYGFDLDYRPIEEIPSGLPMPNFEMFTGFSLTSITPYIFTALL